MSTRKAARRGRAPVPDVHKPGEAYVPGTMEHRIQVRDGTLINCVQADILTFKADAIVNAANTTLRGGGGVDGAIHAAAGPEMLAELRREFPAGGVVGGAYPTKAYNIRTAKHVIHAIGPDFRLEPDEHLDDPRLKTAGTLLKEAYTRSLRVAVLLGARTVAFPTISTDIYAFPRYVAAINAMIAVRNFVGGEGAGKFDRISFLLWPVGGEDWRPYWSNFRHVFGQVWVGSVGKILHTTTLKSTNIDVVRANILTFPAQTIVNRAHAELRGGRGLDGAIHAAAGPELLAELIQGFPAGGATTGAYETGSHNIMSAEKIIHVVGPVYRRVETKAQMLRAEQQLARTYFNILSSAVGLRSTTLAIPTISTGTLAFPRQSATRIALTAVRNFVEADHGRTLKHVSFLLWPAGGPDEEHYAANFKEVFPAAEPEPEPTPNSETNKGKKRTNEHSSNTDVSEMGGLIKGKPPHDRFTLGPDNAHLLLDFRHMEGLEEGESRRDRFTLGPTNENPQLDFNSDKKAERKKKMKARRKARKEKKKAERERKKAKREKRRKKEKKEKKRKSKETSNLESEELVRPRRPERKRGGPDSDDSPPRKRRRKGGPPLVMTPSSSTGSGGSGGSGVISSGGSKAGSTTSSGSGSLRGSAGGPGGRSGGNGDGSGASSAESSSAPSSDDSDGSEYEEDSHQSTHSNTDTDTGASESFGGSKVSTTSNASSNASSASKAFSGSNASETSHASAASNATGASHASGTSNAPGGSSASSNSNDSNQSDVAPDPQAKRQCRAWLPANKRRPVAVQCKNYCKQGTDNRFCYTHRNWEGDSDNETIGNHNG